MRAHGEAGAIVRLLTAEQGLIAAYIAGARGRALRPVLIAGNFVALELAPGRAHRLPIGRAELVTSRGPWLSEPLPAAAIAWICTLTAAACPEQQPLPALYSALGALLDAVCHAPSARGWLPGLIGYERLLLRELGYGTAPVDGSAPLVRFARLGEMLRRHLLCDQRLAPGRSDVMAARERLAGMLARIEEGEA